MKRLMIKIIVLHLLILFYSPVIAQLSNVKHLTTAEWREDLKFMAKEMQLQHKNLFHTVSKKQFDAAINTLFQKIPYLQRHQIILEMAKIVAMIGDGHTNIYPTRDAKVGFRKYPLQLYFFSDGLFIRSAPRVHKDWVGCRIIKFGNTDVATAFQLIQTMIGRDNEQSALFWAPFLMVIPEVLSFYQIIPDMEKLVLWVEKDNKIFKIEMAPEGLADIISGDTDLSWQPKNGWVDMRDDALLPTPLWLSNQPGIKYQYQFLPQHNLVYLQLNEIGNMPAPEDNLEQYCNKLFHFMDSVKAQNFVLDLRLNAGGDAFLNKPLIVQMIKSFTDVKGHSFVITGRRTFSAAQMLINRLAQYSNTSFVGEPASSKMNAYSDSKKIVLPHSQITVRVSSRYHQYGDERDTASWIPVTIPAALSSQAYKTNIDPCMNAILKYIQPM